MPENGKDLAPTPGTQEAHDAGCVCPVLDNNHGRFPVFTDDQGRDQWYLRLDCTIHGEGTEFLNARV